MTTPEMAGGSDRLEDLLFRAYTDGMPPQLETVVAARVNAAIERRLSWNRRARFRRPHMPRRSIRASLAVSVVLLLLAVVAVTAIGQQLFPPGYYEPGGYMWRNAQQLALTQTVDGYRVTLDSVYADVSQLALAVTVQAPDELAGAERPDPRVRVTDSAGVTWQMTTGGVDPTGRATKASLQYVPASEVVPSGAREFTFEVKGTRGRQDPVVVFTTEFTATIDVRGGAIIRAAATSSAAGVTVTLDRVVVSPSSVEVDLHWTGIRPAPERTPWSPFVEVRHDGVLLEAFMGNGPTTGGSWVDRTGEGAESAAGHWTVTVTQLWYDPLPEDGVAAAPSRVVVAGPWTFEFDVP